MSRCVAAWSGIGLIIGLLLMGACTPPPGVGDATQAEGFLGAGTSRVERKDYDGAVAAFEQALRADPNLAQAHHELAQLFDTYLNRPEKALYHYVRMLELQPNHKWADMISNRIGVVKMQLARDSVPAIPSPQLNKEIDRLEAKLAEASAEQQKLLVDNEELRKRLATFSEKPVTAPPTNSPGPTPGTTQNRPLVSAPPATNKVLPARVEPAAAPPRYNSYVSQKGDTLFSLSRRHNTTVDAILAANPGLSVGNFQAGKSIRIPVK